MRFKKVFLWQMGYLLTGLLHYGCDRISDVGDTVLGKSDDQDQSSDQGQSQSSDHEQLLTSALAGRIAPNENTKNGMQGITVQLVGTEHQTLTKPDGSFDISTIAGGSYDIVFLDGESLVHELRQVEIKKGEKKLLPPIYTEGGQSTKIDNLSPKGTIGNGADAIICVNRLNQIISVEILDYYEIRAIRGHKISMGASDLPYQEKIELVLKRLEAMDPFLVRDLRDELGLFYKHTVYLDENNKLPEIDDSGDRLTRPSNCTIRQLAVQVKNPLQFDPRYYIDNELWQQLDQDNKATLILHEIVYRGAVFFGHVDSFATRYFMSIIVSELMENISTEQYVNAIKSANLPGGTKEFKGITYWMGTEELYDSGKIKSIPAADSYELKINDYFTATTLPKTRIYFHEDQEHILAATFCFKRFSYPAPEGCKDLGLSNYRPLHPEIDITTNCPIGIPHGPGSKITFDNSGKIQALEYGFFPGRTDSGPDWVNMYRFCIRRNNSIRSIKYFFVGSRGAKVELYDTLVPKSLSNLSDNMYPTRFDSILLPAELSSYVSSCNPLFLSQNSVVHFYESGVIKEGVTYQEGSFNATLCVDSNGNLLELLGKKVFFNEDGKLTRWEDQ